MEVVPIELITGSTLPFTQPVEFTFYRVLTCQITIFDFHVENEISYFILVLLTCG